MNKVFEGLTGVVCMMDGVLIFGLDLTEYDTRLTAVMECVQAAGVTLNPDKCEFGKTAVKFLGHLVDASGIHADPEKIATIIKMEAPHNVSELR